MASFLDKYGPKDDTEPLVVNIRPSRDSFMKKYVGKEPEAPKMPEPKRKQFGHNPDDPLWARGLKTLDDFVRAAANGATFGLADKLSGAVSGRDEAAISREAQQASPYASLAGDVAGLVAPGIGISAGLGKALPMLREASLASIAANQGVTGATLSAADDVIREGKVPDASDAGLSFAAGAALGPAFALGARYFSPMARLREKGIGVSEGTKAAAKSFNDRVAPKGARLTGPELVDAVNPGESTGLMAAYSTAVGSPKGSRVRAQFEARRTPDMEAAGRRMVNALGKGVEPQAASQAADQAIKNAGEVVRRSARPYYDAAAPIEVPNIPKSAAVKTGRAKVRGNRVLMEGLTRDNGGVRPSPKSVLFNDAAKKEIDALAAKAMKEERGLLAAELQRQASELTNAMDAAAPPYATARDIAGQGRNMVEGLEKGPLGRIRDVQDTRSQAGALFGVGNTVEREAARKAAERLPPDVSRGLLVNRLDTAVSENPAGFGGVALPTRQSEEVAQSILGPEFGDIEDILKASRSVHKQNAQIRPDEDSAGPMGYLWRHARDFNRDKLAALLQDPELIDKYGLVGPIQDRLQLLLTALGSRASNRSDHPR